MQMELLQNPNPEEWKTVSGFVLYECSDSGRFRRRFVDRYCAGTVAFNGYVHIGLMRDGKQVTKLAHRILAETFLIKPTPLHNDVNHKNKDRADNRISNLEWVTRSENSIHSKRVHLRGTKDQP